MVMFQFANNVHQLSEATRMSFVQTVFFQGLGKEIFAVSGAIRSQSAWIGNWNPYRSRVANPRFRLKVWNLTIFSNLVHLQPAKFARKAIGSSSFLLSLKTFKNHVNPGLVNRLLMDFRGYSPGNPGPRGPHRGGPGVPWGVASALGPRALGHGTRQGTHLLFVAGVHLHHLQRRSPAQMEVLDTYSPYIHIYIHIYIYIYIYILYIILYI